MKPLERRGVVMGTLGLLAMLAGGGCSRTGTGPDLTGFVRPGPGVEVPVPGTPANAMRSFEWCFNHRALATYRMLFTDDFRFVASPVDSVGGADCYNPWTREHELAFASGFFIEGGIGAPPATSVRLALDRNFFVYPDPYYAAWDPAGRWHRTIRTYVTLDALLADEMGWYLSSAASFHLVRGDSALIPLDLRDLGFRPDSTRWWISKWVDESGSPGLGVASSPRSRASRAPATLAAQPGRQVTWREFKMFYLPPCPNAESRKAGSQHQ